MSTVLVTGGSGFIAGHILLQLLAAGHRVRTTVRDLAREPEVRATLASAGVDAGSALSFHVANLTSDAGWAEAVSGCDFVLHVASPFPLGVPRDENELIVPARDGAVRVLRAARDAGVKRVVLTSSFAAIGYGYPQQAAPFTEENWTRIDAPGLSAYTKSKTIAERTAWEFLAREGGALELAVVNPVAVFGPVLGPDYATSILIVERMLAGRVPGCPRISFGAVDVRDVADLHLRAMVHPGASGQRFLATAGDFLSLVEIARILKQNLGPAARRVRTLQLPDWVVRLAALRDRSVRTILPELGVQKNATNAKAERILGWTPRSREESILASAESLLRLGLVKP